MGRIQRIASACVTGTLELRSADAYNVFFCLHIDTLKRTVFLDYVGPDVEQQCPTALEIVYFYFRNFWH